MRMSACTEIVAGVGLDGRGHTDSEGRRARERSGSLEGLRSSMHGPLFADSLPSGSAPCGALAFVHAQAKTGCTPQRPPNPPPPPPWSQISTVPKKSLQRVVFSYVFMSSLSIAQRQ